MSIVDIKIDIKDEFNLACSSLSYVMTKPRELLKQIKEETRDYGDAESYLSVCSLPKIEVKDEFGRKEPLLLEVAEPGDLLLQNGDCSKNEEHSEVSVNIGIDVSEERLRCGSEYMQVLSTVDLGKNCVQFRESPPSEEKPVKCEVCSKLFTKRSAVNQHMLTHSGERRFKCEVCEKLFSLKHHLNDHLLTHTGDRRFQCQVCNKSFTQKYTLKKHMRIHTGDKRFKCEVCSKLFIQKPNLNRHLLTHTFPSSTGEKKFKCEICYKLFTQKSTLNLHMRTHTGEKKYKCEHCGKLFTQKCTLNNHVLTHTGEKHFKCELCNKVFTRKCSLRTHIVLIHSKPLFVARVYD